MRTKAGIWSKLGSSGKTPAAEPNLLAKIDGSSWNTVDVQTAYSKIAGSRVATISARSVAKPVSILVFGLILSDDGKIPPAFYITAGGTPFKTNHGSFTFDATSSGSLEGWFAFKKGVVFVDKVDPTAKTIAGRFSATATNIKTKTIQIDGEFADVPFDPAAG